MAKILIIRLTSLGDVIFTLPLVNALSVENEVSFLVAEKGLDAIKNNPCIKNVHIVPLAKWRKEHFSIKKILDFWRLIGEIRAEKYDIALDCQQMFKSLFLMMFCGAKRRITFKDAREFSILAGNEFVKPKAKFRDFNYHIVERNLDFARHLGMSLQAIKFSLPESSEKTKEKVNELLKNINPEKKIVVISPETTWENKHWSVDHWASVAKEIHKDCNLIFTGTEKDLVERIIKKANGEINHLNLVGKTNLEELKELFSRVDLVISPDSGSANLAWASENPAIIEIFTCTPSKRFGVYGKSEKYYAIQGELPCQPCFKKKCRLKTNKNNCCTATKPEQVLEIIRKFI